MWLQVLQNQKELARLLSLQQSWRPLGHCWEFETGRVRPMTQHHLYSVLEAWGQVVGPLWASSIGCGTMPPAQKDTWTQMIQVTAQNMHPSRSSFCPTRLLNFLSNEEVNGNSPNENKQREFIHSSLQQGRWPPSLGSNSGSVCGMLELPLGKRESFRCALIEAVGPGNWSNWLEANCPGKSDWQQVGFLGWLM